VARANASRLGLAGRVRFLEGTIPGAEGSDAEGFDLILANLPYVAERDWPGLAPEVTKWEPREALLAGPDGLDAFRAVVPTLRAKQVGLEVGEGQADAVGEMVREAGFGEIEARRDLAGIERVVVGRR
jgi:release factor glutamine methyltransferase